MSPRTVVTLFVSCAMLVGCGEREHREGDGAGILAFDIASDPREYHVSIRAAVFQEMDINVYITGRLIFLKKSQTPEPDDLVGPTIRPELYDRDGKPIRLLDQLVGIIDPTQKSATVRNLPSFMQDVFSLKLEFKGDDLIVSGLPWLRHERIEVVRKR